MTPANYQEHDPKFLEGVIGQLNCFHQLLRKVYDIYRNYIEYISKTSLLSLLREQSFTYADEVTAFCGISTLFLRWMEREFPGQLL